MYSKDKPSIDKSLATSCYDVEYVCMFQVTHTVLTGILPAIMLVLESTSTRKPQNSTVEPFYSGHHRGMKFWPLIIEGCPYLRFFFINAI